MYRTIDLLNTTPPFQSASSCLLVPKDGNSKDHIAQIHLKVAFLMGFSIHSVKGVYAHWRLGSPEQGPRATHSSSFDMHGGEVSSTRGRWQKQHVDIVLGHFHEVAEISLA